MTKSLKHSVTVSLGLNVTFFTSICPGGGKSGKPLAQANIQLELPRFDPKNLPEWAEEFSEFSPPTGQSHADVETQFFT